MDGANRHRGRFRRRLRCTMYRRYFGTLALILLLGLVLRAFHTSAFHYSPIVDMTTYLKYGEYYMSGYLLGGFVPALRFDSEILWLTTRNPPLYPIFTGLVRALFGWETIRPIMWVQAFVDTFTIALFCLAGRLLYGARAGLVAALGYALFRRGIFNAGQVMTETLAACLVMAAICSFLWFLERPRAGRAVVAGLLLALSVYVRLNVLSLFGAFGLFALVTAWRRRTDQTQFRRVITSAVILFAVAVGALLPWTLRNSLILGHPVYFSGSNALRLLVGANPLSRGEFVSTNSFPEEWKKRLKFAEDPRGLEARMEQDREAEALAREFLRETHPGYFLFTVLPNRLEAELWAEHWMFTGQGKGNISNYPLGPRVRFPLVTSLMIGVLGLFGLFLGGRKHGGFALLTWLALFLPILYLPIDPRYRFMAELVLLLSAAALLTRAYMLRDFSRRLKWILYALLGAGLLGSLLAWARFSGSNILAVGEVQEKYPIVKAMESPKGHTIVIPEGAPTPVTVPVAEFPVDPGHCSHLLVEFDAQLLPPGDVLKKPEAAVWEAKAPDTTMEVDFYNEKGTTVSLAYYPHAPMGGFLQYPSPQFTILELPGTATRAKLLFRVNKPGSVTISSLRALGPIWYMPRSGANDEVSSGPVTGENAPRRSE